MNTDHGGSSTNTGSRRAFHEFSAGRSLVVSTVACLMLLLGAVHWVGSGRYAPAVSAAQPEQAVGGAAASSDYFPAQYVNQAKEAGEDIQAF